MDIVQEYLVLLFNALRYEPILSGLAVLVIFAFIRTFFLGRRITRLTKGGDGKTLEGTIKTLGERVGALETHAKKTELALKNLDTRMQGTLRGVSVERFDPFQNAGGQQSFTTAFLNEKGDGVVISGIHSRDIVRVYAKEITGFASKHELSEEEKQSIKKAHASLT